MMRVLVTLLVMGLVIGLGYLWERHVESRVPGEYTDAGEDGL